MRLALERFRLFDRDLLPPFLRAPNDRPDAAAFAGDSTARVPLPGVVGLGLGTRARP